MFAERDQNTQNSTLDFLSFRCIAFSINGAGGGGNVRELYNPTGEGITGLVEEMERDNSREVPFCTAEMLRPNDSVCCVARLGSPGAKADSYANKAAQAIVEGLKALAKETELGFPKAIFPVEATAGQMARAARAVIAACRETGKKLALLDGDVCGGMAVPAVPLAFNIYDSLATYPQVALVQLVTENNKVRPLVEIIIQPNPEKLEKELREMAASSEMGAVWFAWLMTTASKFNQYFTPGAVSSSIKRGRIVEEAVRNGQNPAEALLRKGEIDRIVTQGRILKVTNESKEAPGFAQFSYMLETPSGPMILAARNEFIVLYRQKNKGVVCRGPLIISVLTAQGPVQSHVLNVDDEVSIVVATPQAILNNPERKEEWDKIWKKYWQTEINRGTWRHPY